MNDEPEHWNVPRELRAKLHDRASELRQRATPSEERLWAALSGRKQMGRKFRRQVPIGGFIVDFYCSEERLVIEVDGLIHTSQREADSLRQQALEEMGLRVLRYENAQVDNDLLTVLAHIREVFNR
jgi:very-short-patch-repair endonuclease